jgi:hypothetical protein
MYGDAGGSVSDHANAGDDTLNVQVTGLPPGGLLFGPIVNVFADAGGNLLDHAKGGNDGITLSLGEGHFTDTVYGDAGGNLSGFAQGGTTP